MLRALLVTAAAVAFAASAAVAPAQAPAEFPHDVNPEGFGLPGYLPAGAVDSVAILPAPPAPDSPRGRADRARYDETRGLVDSPLWRQAVADNDLGAGTFHRFSCAAGYVISPSTTPVTYRMMARLDRDVRSTTAPLKERYRRQRPLIGNTARICLPREPWMETSFSYPSSHATQGWAYGLILAEIAPERANTLFQAGYEYGESRVVCGVHFQSDVDAGRVLGGVMVARLRAEPQFQADLILARAEAAAARGGTPPVNCAP